MERGGRIMTIVPERSPPATKSDYWIPLRPASDGALFLGVIKVLMDENLYDADFCKQYTDSPILIQVLQCVGPDQDRAVCVLLAEIRIVQVLVHEDLDNPQE